MNVGSFVQSFSAASGAAVVVGTVARRYWVNREARQQAAFKQAVSQIVREQTAELLAQQAAQVARIRGQLDRQDRAIAALGRTVNRLQK